MVFHPKRLYTPDEANRALPLVRRIVADIAETYQRLIDNSELASSANPDELVGLDTAHREEMGDVCDRIEADKKLLTEYVAELDKMGILLKGPLDGLVDFPAKKGDRVVFLCWKSGEAAVGHWHEIDAGFLGREPICSPDFDAEEATPSKAACENAVTPAAAIDPRPRKETTWNSSRSS